MEEPKKTSTPTDHVLTALIVSAVIGVLVFWSVIVAVAVRKLAKNRVGRLESLAVAGVGLVWLVVGLPTWIVAVGRWWLSLFGMLEDPLTSLPVVDLTVLGAVIAMLTIASGGTKIAAWVPARIGKYNPLKKSDVADTGILPTDEEKRLANQAVVSIPVQAMASTSVRNMSDEKRGSRSFPVGVDKHGAPILISENEINKHGLIFGSTGSGKTETIKAIAGGLLDLGWHGLLLDLKEDAATGGLLDWCGIYANSHAIPFQQFRLSDPKPAYWFSPLLGMGPDEAFDTIIGSQTFEAAYYEALNKKQLGQLVQLMYAAHTVDPVRYEAPTVYDIGKILAAPSLEKATRELVAVVITNIAGYSKDDFHTLVAPDKAMTETAAGLGARLTSMYETQAGRVALRGGDGRIAFDVTQSGLSYVGLDSLGKPELTKLVSTSVLQRMAVYAADRTSGRVVDAAPRFLIVDEANFVARRVLLNLLSRARSAGIATIVCTQGPTDWTAREPGEPDLTSLVQNTNVAVIMSQGERTNAELCADIIGRAEKSVMTQQFRDGELTTAGSMSTTVDYLVSPDALRSLTIGEAVIRVGKPAEWARYTKIAQRDPRTIYKH